MIGITAQTMPALAAAISTLLAPSGVSASPLDDQRTVAELDLAYQAAVKRNDHETMGRILHEEFVLVRGDGTVITREQIIEEARSGDTRYEIQDEEPGTQTVRVWGDTAVVTALLRLKGESNGKPFDQRVWFSDTYVRTPDGWRYAFAQVSLPLPDESSSPE